jgi:DNA-binding MarR family transcriptional regulator
MTKPLQTADRQRVQNLAEFRYALRNFLQFSEKRAEDAGLHPQQHQLLLHIAGAPEGVEATVSYAAERLGLRHHSVVELSKRCEEAGLIRRAHDSSDRRRVVLLLTAEGQRVLRTLSDDHERELYELLPTLIRTLTQIRTSHKRTAKSAVSTALTKRNQK